MRSLKQLYRDKDNRKMNVKEYLLFLREKSKINLKTNNILSANLWESDYITYKTFVDSISGEKNDN